MIFFLHWHRGRGRGFRAMMPYYIGRGEEGNRV